MSELIKKSELVEWIKNWFNTNRYYHPYSKSNNIPFSEVLDILERIPTIDAVQVVRCKECRFFKPWDNGYYGKCKAGHAVTADMFCSCGSRADGERKDDEQ